jgi:hypothetical protein
VRPTEKLARVDVDILCGGKAMRGAARSCIRRLAQQCKQEESWENNRAKLETMT